MLEGSVKIKVAFVTVVESTNLLKVAVMKLLMLTSIAPFSGEVLTTCGAVVSVPIFGVNFTSTQ